ncbi:MAG: hypothetical protein H7256_03380 [Bdellovibrio sp.]|nr:hypothetical protein [Bdellovibrio sp.]
MATQVRMRFKLFILSLLVFTLSACGRTSIISWINANPVPAVPNLPTGSPFKIATNMGSTPGNDSARALAQQSDGKIIVGGNSVQAMEITRLTTAGVLDMTFGSAGYSRIHVGLVHSAEKLNALLIQPDGKIIVVGSSGSWGTGDFAVARLNADGSFDTSFGVGGKVITDISSGSDDEAYAAALQADGKILVAGKMAGTTQDFAIVRYNLNGTLDTSFGTGGKLILDISAGGADVANGIAVQSDGKIIVTGYTTVGGSKDLAIARISSVGALDNSFGNAGVVVTSINSDDLSFGVAIQADGKILQGGTVQYGTMWSVIRYTTAGVLDGTFGSGGIATTTFGGATTQATAMTLQSDGKIVIAGFAVVGGSTDFASVRLATTGALDTTFNGSGKLTIDIGLNSYSSDNAYAVLAQADGKIVLAGDASTDFFTNYAIYRISAVGIQDNTFGVNGQVTFDGLSPSLDEMHVMVKQPDGKIIQAGRTNATGTMNFILVRSNKDGSLDSTFGVSGKVITDINPAIESADSISAIALQGDGKILVSGYYYNGAVFGSLGFATARYNANGVLDATFGTGGIVVANAYAGSSDDPVGIIIQSDGKIIVAGHSYHGGLNNAFLARFTSSGVLDSSFGSSGFVLPTYGVGSYDSTTSAIAQPDGKILVVGSTDAAAGTDDDMAMMRFLPDGTLDVSFGTGGKMIANFNSGLHDGISCVTLLSDGKILAAGYINNGTDNQLAVVRFNSNGALDTSFGASGKFMTTVGSGASYGTAMALQSDEKIVIGGTDNNSNIVVVRATSSGFLDTSFAVNGQFVLDFSGNHSISYVSSLLVESDDQILVGGTTTDTFDINDFFLMRLNFFM